MSDEKVTLTYGIWIPGKGWLKGKDIFADTSLEKARQVAYLIGHGAVVRFIDESIVDLENKYLEWERMSAWQKIKTTINLSLSNSSKKTIRS